MQLVDLNGDQAVDLLTISLFNGIAWYSNDGSGGFGTTNSIDIFSEEADLVYSADLDGDGDMDVLSAGGSDISWYENDGSGEFGVQNVIADTPSSVASIHCADLDGDGDMDVLSAMGDMVVWYSNEGFGEFSDAVVINVEPSTVRSLYSVDIDSDGDMDVLSAGGTSIFQYMNNGSGEFGPQVVVSSSALAAKSVHSADLDGDGDMDVLSASSNDNKIAWYENDGSGAFGPQNVISSLAFGAYSVFGGDIDGDGDIDVLSASSDDKIAWYENDGSAGFGPQIVISEVTNGGRPVYSEDLDGDGDMDVLSADINFLYWHKNNDLDGFSERIQISDFAQFASDVYSADIDADGDMDLLSASYNKIAWYENDGSGAFGQQMIITTSVDGARSVYSADLDGDGDFDVLSASNADDKIAWYQNDGSGGFNEQQEISTMADGAYSVHSGDLDGDGDMDVLSASTNDDKIAWYENDGSGGFGEQQVISTLADGAYSVHSVDLDGDGDMDVLSASTEDGKTAWYENDGSGGFGVQNVIGIVDSGNKSVYSADFDGDGELDVLSAGGDGAAIWFKNEGSGVFGPQNEIGSEAGTAHSVYAIDLDGDGDVDVLTASTSDNKVSWYENDGMGGIGGQNILVRYNSQVTFGAWSVHSTDFDADGDMDVVFASYADSQIAWHENLTGEGCIDPDACNYDPSMWIDDGSCCYGSCGCTTQGAENYSVDATCDIGNCSFEVLGTVFFDENQNGVMDGSEYGLPFQQLYVLPDSLELTTNNEGQFLVSASGSDEYSFILTNNALFPFSTTPATFTFDATIDNWNEDLFFGVSNEFPAFDFETNLYSPGPGYPCDELRNHEIFFRNTGNYPVDVVVEFEYDTLFQGFEEVSVIDSMADNRVYLSYQNLLPGHIVYLEIDLHTPTVDYIGEYLETAASVFGYFEGEQVGFGTDSISEELTCAYDPNDKQVYPNGYSDEHYIANDTTLEYLIRFQNTGNAPATDVIIRDTLDVHLDISSFQLVANSHSVFTTVDPESREVEFYFQDIQLPDSVNNEPESHGLISFKVRPEEGLPLLTELNNTAAIFFDNNPPIITNATWSTIYDCSLFEVEFTQEGAILTASEGDDFQWYFDGAPIEGATSQVLVADANGEYAVEISNGFPCTGLSSSIFILVDDIIEWNSLQITLFPNPMTSSAILDLGHLESPFTLEIYDLLGNRIRSVSMSSQAGSVTIEREGMSAGQYILRLIGDDGDVELPFCVE